MTKINDAVKRAGAKVGERGLGVPRRPPGGAAGLVVQERPGR